MIQRAAPAVRLKPGCVEVSLSLEEHLPHGRNQNIGFQVGVRLFERIPAGTSLFRSRYHTYVRKRLGTMDEVIEQDETANSQGSLKTVRRRSATKGLLSPALLWVLGRLGLTEHDGHGMGGGNEPRLPRGSGGIRLASRQQVIRSVFNVEDIYFAVLPWAIIHFVPFHNRERGNGEFVSGIEDNNFFCLP